MLKLNVALLSVCLSGVLTEQVKTFNFTQHDYEIDFEHFDLVRFNKPYVNFFKITTFKYNRTCPAVNMTYQFKIEVGNDMEIITQAYVFLSNEYREFPLRLEVNFCDAVSKNYMGVGGFTKCGNFTGCPIRKGRIYHYCYWTMDQSQFPPFIPDGRYMLEFQGLYHDVELFVSRLHGRVYRPIIVKP